MRIKDVIRAEKADVTYGGWHTGQMPKSLFPLGKSGKHSLNFRGGYDWQAVRFGALAAEFRVVVAVNFAKCEYYAHLGKIVGSDTQMLVSYEYHATHGGWHVHAGCGDIDLIPVGRYKGPWKRSIPKNWADCRQTEWGVATKEAAISKACKAFGIPEPPLDEAEKQMQLL
ncbi:MAG: hypothetical protein RBS02_03270 [Steroidobacteraceae bacterium]|jgi:hypothetical protein|nr:hypothetical protein [Steroidobacteraceae bacterium]